MSIHIIEYEGGIPPKLVPMCIPTGWIMEWNQFYDLEPILENGVLINAPQFNDSEDLLWMRTAIPEDMKGIWEEVSIDLGWYRTKFTVKLFIKPKDKIYAEYEYPEPVAEISTTSVRVVQETINDWLQNWQRFSPRVHLVFEEGEA
jgi:hypothetical protein